MKVQREGSYQMSEQNISKHIRSNHFYEEKIEEELVNNYYFAYLVDTDLSINSDESCADVEGSFELYTKGKGMHIFFTAKAFFTGKEIEVEFRYEHENWQIETEGTTKEELLKESGLTEEMLEAKMNYYINEVFIPNIKNELPSYFKTAYEEVYDRDYGY